MACKFLTFNCNGIRSKLKRKTLFRFLKKNKYKVVCLQETFITNADVEQWSREWHGQLFHIPGTVHSKGQIILINNNFEISDVCIKSYGERIQLLTFK